MPTCRIHRTVIMAATLVLYAISGSYGAESLHAPKLTPLSITGKNRSSSFTVELATSPQQLSSGLMHRQALADDHGMLFIFPQTKEQYMWMKNTLIPLDMLFIDDTGNIVNIAANNRPLDETIISSEKPAKATLEVIGGTCERLGIQVGDKVIHEAFSDSILH